MPQDTRAADERGDSAPPARLVIVTGSGRSGTSTVAGSLKKLGLTIPQPEVEPDETNPRGFFEPRWAVDFHKRVLKQAGVRTLDGRPWAVEEMAATARDEQLATELDDWLAGQLPAEQLVVKDPRAFWLRDLWLGSAGRLGVQTCFLTMLRHPAEVVGSRDMHYLASADAEQKRSRETANLAGWVNVALVNERGSRGLPRAFARYTDLIEDWRTAMSAVGEQLDLRYDADLAAGGPHPIDDFIDGGLRRAQLGWDDLDVPPALGEIAEQVWTQLDVLVKDPQDAGATAALDALAERYDALYRHAAALVADHVAVETDRARRRGRRRALQESAAQTDQPGGSSSHAPSLVRRVARRARALRAGAAR